MSAMRGKHRAVAAGVVSVTHAQERGFSLLCVG
jgi:hypothetical protein